MTKLERNILKSIGKSLTDSAVTTWSSGGLNDWTELSKRMITVIKVQSGILDTLISEETNPSIEPELPED